MRGWFSEFFEGNDVVLSVGDGILDEAIEVGVGFWRGFRGITFDEVP